MSRQAWCGTALLVPPWGWQRQLRWPRSARVWAFCRAASEHGRPLPSGAPLAGFAVRRRSVFWHRRGALQTFHGGTRGRGVGGLPGRGGPTAAGGKDAAVGSGVSGGFHANGYAASRGSCRLRSGCGGKGKMRRGANRAGVAAGPPVRGFHPPRSRLAGGDGGDPTWNQ